MILFISIKLNRTDVFSLCWQQEFNSQSNYFLPRQNKYCFYADTDQMILLDMDLFLVNISIIIITGALTVTIVSEHLICVWSWWHLVLLAEWVRESYRFWSGGLQGPTDWTDLLPDCDTSPELRARSPQHQEWTRNKNPLLVRQRESGSHPLQESKRSVSVSTCHSLGWDQPKAHAMFSITNITTDASGDFF